MRSIFAAVDRGNRIPVSGDLIRNNVTGNFINIVLDTFPIDGRIAVRSVRYGTTDKGVFKLLQGKRSRLIYFTPGQRSHWEIVEEYRRFDNHPERMAIVESLKNVDTAYRPPPPVISERDA